MLVKAVFLTVLIIFSILSFFIDLPPGTIVTETANLSFPFSTFITKNLINGIFFATIIGLIIYLAKRKFKPISSYTPITRTSRLDHELKNILTKEQQLESDSNLTQIKGIGPKRAIELEIAGVKTISDLAKRSPQHLAEKTGIPITQVSNWIIEANKLKK
jgi:hypothetical protein